MIEKNNWIQYGNDFILEPPVTGRIIFCELDVPLPKVMWIARMKLKHLK